MKISDMSVDRISLDNKDLLTRILFNGIEDDGENGDVIFVFGSVSANKYRVPHAVELYKSGRSAKILMSGGALEVPEAISMKNRAIELGVLEQDIIVETLSKNTIDNVLKSREVLDEYFGLNHIKRILIVTTFYHIRRCYLTLKTYLPEHIEYSLCPAQDKSTRPTNWWESQQGTQRVMKEVEGLIYYTKNSKIQDFEV
ncbi:YdcF family protein [Paenibacillus shunpengii]|uniref:YdcF family protein n=1 Tax=Paenibacillus shunpengii TaxID=2054424 RepID=A0ABW5SIM0_9BACL